MLRLRELRAEKEKTQVELASVLGVSRQVYANYENGINEPSIDTLIRLADYFECSIDYLVSREDDFGHVVLPNSNTELTSEEKTLLETFRKLNTKNRLHVTAYAEVRLEEQGKEFLHA